MAAVTQSSTMLRSIFSNSGHKYNISVTCALVYKVLWMGKNRIIFYFCYKFVVVV
jgi:hypothetical protein